MPSQYYIDLEQVSLERFRRMLASKTLLPSRQILHEQLEARFQTLAAQGIRTLQDLHDALKTKRDVARLAETSGLPQAYLTILRREVNSYIPRPVNLDKIPELDPDHLERLAEVDIKHTRHLYERAGQADEREALAERVGIPPDALLEIVKLADLARILGVGGVFARLLYEAGIQTVEAFVDQPPKVLLARVQAANEKKGYTRVTLTEEDLAYCMETARLLPRGITWT
jgi:hypothetical protein